MKLSVLIEAYTYRIDTINDDYDLVTTHIGDDADQLVKEFLDGSVDEDGDGCKYVPTPGGKYGRIGKFVETIDEDDFKVAYLIKN